MELARNRNELLRVRHRFDAGNYRHLDADRPGPVHELAERPRIEDHLSNNVVGPGLHLVLEMAQVVGEVRRLVVLLRVSGNAEAEVGRHRVVQRLKVAAPVHCGNLGGQL